MPSNAALFREDVERSPRTKHIGIMFELVGFLDVAMSRKYIKSAEARICVFVAGALLHYLMGELSLLIGGIDAKSWHWSHFDDTPEGRAERIAYVNASKKFKSILNWDGKFGMRDGLANCPYFIMCTGKSGGLIGEGMFEGE